MKTDDGEVSFVDGDVISHDDVLWKLGEIVPSNTCFGHFNDQNHSLHTPIHFKFSRHRT